MSIIWSSGLGDVLSSGGQSNFPSTTEGYVYFGRAAAEVAPEFVGGGGDDTGGGGTPPEGIPIEDYEIAGGEFPWGLTLNRTTGEITGNTEDMDNYISAFFPPNSGLTHDAPYAPEGFISWPYASFGSAKPPGIGMARFQIKANAVGEESTIQEFSITIRNNWTSDRNFFVRSLFGPEYLQSLIDSWANGEWQ